MRYVSAQSKIDFLCIIVAFSRSKHDWHATVTPSPYNTGSSPRQIYIFKSTVVLRYRRICVSVFVMVEVFVKYYCELISGSLQVFNGLKSRESLRMFPDMRNHGHYGVCCSMLTQRHASWASHFWVICVVAKVTLVGIFSPYYARDITVPCLFHLWRQHRHKKTAAPACGTPTPIRSTSCYNLTVFLPFSHKRCNLLLLAY